MEKEKTEEIYHWSDIRHNEIMVTPDMLTDTGIVVRCNARLKGQSPNDSTQPRSVRFDKYYVENLLRKRFKRVSNSQLRTFLEDFIKRELS